MITEAVQDYLKTIYKLQQRDQVTSVNTSLVAERMTVSAASATNMIKKLAEMNLVDHEPYQGVLLTDTGEKMALEILRHHRLLELYLAEALGYSIDEVHAEAERLEHAISEDFEDRIDRALGYPTVGAHGEPIPTKQGQIASHDYDRLADVESGQAVVIRRVSDHSPEMLRYMLDRGLTLGTRITVQDKAPFDGPMLLKVAAAEEHLSLEVARHIYVETLS
jgi:DtxR family transcriptional regulator, Mn-dependent transcriptional regulator